MLGKHHKRGAEHCSAIVQVRQRELKNPQVAKNAKQFQFVPQINFNHPLTTVFLLGMLVSNVMAQQKNMRPMAAQAPAKGEAKTASSTLSMTAAANRTMEAKAALLPSYHSGFSPNNSSFAVCPNMFFGGQNFSKRSRKNKKPNVDQKKADHKTEVNEAFIASLFENPKPLSKSAKIAKQRWIKAIMKARAKNPADKEMIDRGLLSSKFSLVIAKDNPGVGGYRFYPDKKEHKVEFKESSLNQAGPVSDEAFVLHEFWHCHNRMVNQRISADIEAGAYPFNNIEDHKKFEEAWLEDKQRLDDFTKWMKQPPTSDDNKREFNRLKQALSDYPLTVYQAQQPRAKFASLGAQNVGDKFIAPSGRVEEVMAIKPHANGRDVTMTFRLTDPFWSFIERVKQIIFEVENQPSYRFRALTPAWFMEVDAYIRSMFSQTIRAAFFTNIENYHQQRAERAFGSAPVMQRAELRPG